MILLYGLLKVNLQFPNLKLKAEVKNSVDHDEAAQNELHHLHLHYLPSSL